VLDALRTLAPVRAIRGNNDKGAWARSLPTSDVVEVGSLAIYMLHSLAELDLDPATAGFTAVVFGHSHKPAIEERGRILFVKPPAAPVRGASPCRSRSPHLPCDPVVAKRGSWTSHDDATRPALAI
jgi:uncharacterized protein